MFIVFSCRTEKLKIQIVILELPKGGRGTLRSLYSGRGTTHMQIYMYIVIAQDGAQPAQMWVIAQDVASKPKTCQTAQTWVIAQDVSARRAKLTNVGHT